MNLNLNLNFNITSSISAPQRRDSLSNGSENSVQTATKALQRLLKDSSKKHVGLRKGCQDALDYLTQFQSRIVEQNIPVDDNGLPTNNTAELDKLANKLIIPIKFACESRQSKLMTTALDFLQKLMAYHYFRGEAIDEENPDKPLMAKVSQTIGSCFDYPDDSVQLQIIKAYFTAVTEPTCALHDNLLMNAVRTIYNIYLVSRNQVNQSTAKATLTQMLNTIFQRMESEMSTDVVIGFDETFDEDDFDKKASGEFKNVTPMLPKKLQPKVNQPPQIVETPVDEVTSPEVIAQQKEDLNDFVHDLVSKMIENAQIESKNAKVSETVRKASNHIFTDCFVIFRALCKLSTKEIPKDANELNSLDLKSKLLSLELLLSIIENSGPVMRSCVKFINTAIKKIPSISRSHKRSFSTSQSIPLFSLYLFSSRLLL